MKYGYIMEKKENWMHLIDVYTKLEREFSNHGFNLYIVGGTSRDMILGKPLFDFDFVTDAKIEDIESFVEIQTFYREMGSATILFEGKKIDITTLRKESEYFDFRHPTSISFVSKPIDDAPRRDFTINAIYIDKKGEIIDFYRGMDDIRSGIIRMIGDPYVRIKEDPLRILRALRFSLILGFKIERTLINAIRENAYLLRRLNYAKCLNEIKKMIDYSKLKAIEILKEYGIDSYIPIDYGFNNIPVIDMHCDTITRRSVKDVGIYDNEDLHVDIKKMAQSHYMLQCFAIFVNLSQGRPFEKANSYIDEFEKQMKLNKHVITPVTHYREVMDAYSKHKIAALLSIEEGGVLEGKLENLTHFYKRGVRMMTLTWNYVNEIGYPNLEYSKTKINRDLSIVDDKHGLTPFGIEVVKKMNQLGMIIDVSHLSDKGFYDVIEHSTSPIVASHSNARNICGVSRNLTDDMILKIKEKHGLIGMNFCPDFVSIEHKNEEIKYLVKHIIHIKDIAGIGVIALGSDFDGIPTPNELEDASKIHLLENALLKAGFSRDEIDKIFYKNFLRLLKRVCK